MKQLYPVIAITAFLSACGLSGPLRVDPKALRFETAPLPREWTKAPKVQEDSAADFVYINKSSNAYLAINSMCQRYPDASLESLNKQLMAPLANVEILNQEKRMMDEREALASSARGFLDGVAVEARFIVLRKNECIFDFSLISSAKINEADERSFQKLADSFRYRGGVKEP